RAASAKVTRAPAHHRARAKSHHRAASAHHQAASASTSAGASTTATSSSVAAPPSSATAPSAAGLQAQGHQELADGSYSSAISNLHRALDSADPSSLTYAYALYDLGRALTLSGDPKDAIPVLEQRMKIPNQTPVVQQALDQARQQAGVAPAPAPTQQAGVAPAPAPTGGPPKTTNSSPAPPSAHRSGHRGGHAKETGNPSGGAGLPGGGGDGGG